MFAQLQAIGSTVGGVFNTLDITGSLTDRNGGSGITQITDFTVDIAKNATFEANQLGTFSGSHLDDFGLFNLNGGLGTVTNSILLIETTGSFTAQQIQGFSGSTLVDIGTISLTGGGGLANVNGSSITIAAGASLAAQQINGVNNSSLDILGNVSLSGGGGIGIGNLNNSTITIGKHGNLTTAEINGNASDTLIVNGNLLFNTTGGDDLNGTHVTINSHGTLTNDGYESGNQTFAINGGTYIGTESNPTETYNYGGVAGGIVELKNDVRYGDNYTISNFAKGDELIIGPDSNNDSLTVFLNNGTLTVRDLSVPVSPYYTDPNILYQVNHFSLAAGTTAADLHAKAVNGQVELVACFYPGTLLATPTGTIAAEAITAGTLLTTSTGAAKPVRWLGRSTVSTRFADPLRALPIRIKAGALADGLPARDLLVSPCHAMFIGGVLIQAGALVNGVSVLREANVPEIFTYYHVELATHEILFAEGAATESFIDNVDRMHFDNWAEHEALGETAPITEMPYPRAKAARQVPVAIRSQLDMRIAATAIAA